MSAATDNIAKGAGARPRRALNRGWLRILLMLSVPLVLILGAGYFYITGGRYVSTDDAYVQADLVAMSADVGGRVIEVDVHDNQQVKKGQLLFKLDDRPYRIALERAQAQLASTRLEVDGLRAAYRQKLADLKAAQDTLAYQEHEFARQQQLLAQHVTSQAKFDEARHNLDNARQQLAATQEQIANTLASLGGNPNIATDDHPLVQAAQAQVNQAELNLSYTVVRAPADGIVTKVDKLPVGQYLNATVPAFSLVSTDHVWIEANFKETELTHMKPGDEATISVDAYPDATFKARVTSLSPGTGSQFSVLPPQNATGNWVKVVQRVPVKIVLDEIPPDDKQLRLGLSVEAAIDIRNVRGSLISSLLQWQYQRSGRTQIPTQ